MTLDVDKEKMMIMGVIFDNKKVFKSVWFALSTNMIEGWHPTVEDVERLREEAILESANQNDLFLNYTCRFNFLFV